jgi:hypothetical protein
MTMVTNEAYVITLTQRGQHYNFPIVTAAKKMLQFYMPLVQYFVTVNIGLPE